VPFGTYVQAHDEPNFKNSQQPRALDCIYLRYVDNIQGGHQSLDLSTGATIKRRSITQVPITQHVIDLVHKIAEADGIKEGLKITNKSNVMLFDSSWHAGADYDENEHEEVEETATETDDEDENTSDEMNPNEILDTQTNHQLNKNTNGKQPNPEESNSEESEAEAEDWEAEPESTEPEEGEQSESGINQD
jgi:hypothetical protein